MANVISKTTLIYQTSVNTPDFPTADYVINPLWNPDITTVLAVPAGHRKITGGNTVEEMTAAEKLNNPLPGVDIGMSDAFKFPVRAATTGALQAHTRSGNVLTASGNGAFPAQDGVTLTANQRLLVKNEGGGTHLENGPYILATLGDGTHPWILQRASDSNSGVDIATCMTIPVQEGTLNQNKEFVCTTVGPITINTTALTFGRLSTDASNITSGTLALLRGGTGVSAASKAVAFDALAPTAAKGGIIVFNGTNYVALTVGADDTVLTADAAQASGVKWAAAGGGSDTFDDIYNNSGASPAVVVDNGAVRWGDGAALPALDADTLTTFANTSAAGDDAGISILSGTAGIAHLMLGDSASEFQGVIRYANSSSQMQFFASGNLMATVTQTAGWVFNPNGESAIDFAIGSDNDTHSFFLDSGTRNTVLCGASAIPAFQSMVRGQFWGDMSTAPTSAPAAGAFFWVDSGVPKIWQSGGLTGPIVVGRSSVYTRTATVVEDRTLLASASATVTNNNNVLAAIIADLQAALAIA